MRIKLGISTALATALVTAIGTLGVSGTALAQGAGPVLEEVVVTADGCKVITLFPCEELMVANAY